MLLPLALWVHQYIVHYSKSLCGCFIHANAPSEIIFEEQSYSSLHSGRSLEWDHFRGDIADFCGIIANFCGVIADPCDVTIPEVISGRRCGNTDRCVTH